MDLTLFNYTFPKDLIAQHPLPRRDDSRMMVLQRAQKNWEHKKIQNLPDFLQAGDLLVLNDTKVFPARLMGEDGEGKKIEILLLEQNENQWRCLGKPLKRIKEGMKIRFTEDFKGMIVGRQNGFLEIEFDGENVEGKIESAGLPPLPPYIRRKIIPEDKERYQAIFARQTGSAAAPTASLHFSRELLETIQAKGIATAFVTLHVSSDTFLPIRAPDIRRHKMHGERFFISKETQEKIRRTKKNGGKVIAIGTTVARALESDWSQPVTHLFITPGFDFKIVGGLLTNFHQPCSTLLLLVCAFAGREFVLSAYQEAIQKKYRLFSYGDCMLII